MSADDLVQRAAEVLLLSARGRIGMQVNPNIAARALADAGLLHDGPKLTDAERAVLDAAERQAESLASNDTVNPMFLSPTEREAIMRTNAAVRARREVGR